MHWQQCVRDISKPGSTVSYQLVAIEIVQVVPAYLGIFAARLNNAAICCSLPRPKPLHRAKAAHLRMQPHLLSLYSSASEVRKA